MTIFANKVFVSGGVDVSQVTSQWFESTVTFNLAPTVTAPFVSNAPVSASNSFVTIDITPLVQQWLTGAAPNNGVEITPAVAQPSTLLSLDSKEATATSHAAILNVTLVLGGGAAGPTGATGPAGPSGPIGA